jgi:hypothetical protein
MHLVLGLKQLNRILTEKFISMQQLSVKKFNTISCMLVSSAGNHRMQADYQLTIYGFRIAVITMLASSIIGLFTLLFEGNAGFRQVVIFQLPAPTI